MVGKAPARTSHSATAPRRKSSVAEPHKKEKGRSRNACDRCKQKKVKCDGEGQRVCSICREGDFQCTYAQRPHDEKRQYRKGYVEMVEEANTYYKNGLHQFYQHFQSADIFVHLQKKYASGGAPTVQEIIVALGVLSSGKAHEAGIDAINEHLEKEDKPWLVRHGEWDREESSNQHSSPSHTYDDELDDDSEPSSPLVSAKRSSFEEDVNSARGSSPEHTIHVANQLRSMDTARRPSSYYLSNINTCVASGSSNGSPRQPSTPDFSAIPNPYHPMATAYELPPNAALGFADYTTSIPAGLYPLSMDLGTVSLQDLEMQPSEPIDGMAYNGDLTSSLLKSGHFGTASYFPMGSRAMRQSF